MSTRRIPRRSQAEIEALAQAFKAGSLPNSEFNHHAHMTVALWYLDRLSYPQAEAAMRAAIQRFAARHGHAALYHETITLFWLKALHHYRQSAGPQPLPDLVYGALERLGDKDLLFAHYSREAVLSDAARRAWVAPDRLALP
jgi:hypothetical protein